MASANCSKQNMCRYINYYSIIYNLLKPYNYLTNYLEISKIFSFMREKKSILTYRKIVEYVIPRGLQVLLNSIVEVLRNRKNVES